MVNFEIICLFHSHRHCILIVKIWIWVYKYCPKKILFCYWMNTNYNKIAQRIAHTTWQFRSRWFVVANIPLIEWQIYWMKDILWKSWVVYFSEIFQVFVLPRICEAPVWQKNCVFFCFGFPSRNCGGLAS